MGGGAKFDQKPIAGYDNVWFDAEFDLLSGTQGCCMGPVAGAVVGCMGALDAKLSKLVLYVLYDR